MSRINTDFPLFFYPCNQIRVQFLVLFIREQL